MKQFRETEDAQKVNFTIKYLPFELFPEASKEGVDKYDWYMKKRYDGSKEKMAMYEVLMGSYGAGVGINFKFHGTVANTVDAHRMIQYFQEEKGPETADKIISCKDAVAFSPVDLLTIKLCIRNTSRTRSTLQVMRHF